jgi:hypothetical protein
MSYDRDAAMDQLAEWEEEKRMEEYYGQQMNEYYEFIQEFDEEMEREEYLRDLAEDQAAKPKYQKDDEYYESEAALDEQAELEYKEQLKKYYDELELEQMIELEEKQLESIVGDYYGSEGFVPPGGSVGVPSESNLVRRP